MCKKKGISFYALFFCAILFIQAKAATPSGQSFDWPMWGFNPERNGISPHRTPDELHLQWVREMPQPRRAWPAQVDDGDKLEFDLSYSPVVMGEKLFICSMTTDSLTAYDISTGRKIWRYYSDGPARLAPAAWNGKVYFVSDDGHLYCVNAENGILHWRFDARPAEHLVLGNDRVVSMWAARGGPVVKDGKVYFAAGIWPFLGTFVYALNAETGEVIWKNTEHSTRWQAQPHAGAFAFAGLSPQGYLAVSGERLVVSGGRSFPAVFDRHNGALIHSQVRGPKLSGGYRVKIQGDYYFNHGLRYHLSDGESAGRGSIVSQKQESNILDAVVSGSVEWPANWRIFGPLDREDKVITTEILGTFPEKIDAGGKIFKGIDVEVTDNIYSFPDMLREEPVGRTAYVFLKFNSAQEQEVTLGMGADWWMQAWVNGELVHDTSATSNIHHPFSIWNHLVNVKVQKGENVLAVRFIRGGGTELALGGPDQLRQTSIPYDPSIIAPEFAHNLPDTVIDKLDGEVFETVAAKGRLFAVTDKGTIYCFGSEAINPEFHRYVPLTPQTKTDEIGERAEQIINKARGREGYALFLGAGNGDLIEQIALRSDFHIVAIEPDREKTNLLRRRFDDAGLYGKRIAIMHGNPVEMLYPKYISSLVVLEDFTFLGQPPDTEFLNTLYEKLRPYSGKAVIMINGELKNSLTGLLESFNPENGNISITDTAVVIHREGPLAGSGQWTHQYADSAQSAFSTDTRVKPPFGPIWFGGPNNENILPRHATGPRPQVSGGRIVILGVETISARCVFTGREMWTREFPGIGHPFTNLALEERWRAGRGVSFRTQAGAAYIGTPYVTLPDSIYLRYRGRVFRLNSETGETISEWKLPVRSVTDEKVTDTPDWGHISIFEDIIITTTNPHIFRGGALGAGGEDSWDGTSSERLAALDRNTGEVLWIKDAGTAFRHNAIVTGREKLFVNDLLSEEALAMALRRGMEIAERPRLSALDIRTGREVWALEENDIFGTFLSYSAEHDILLEGGSLDCRSPAHLPDEPRAQMVARRGSDGKKLWVRDGRYSGPVILHGDTIIPARPGPAVCIHTGENASRQHPVTGENMPLSYWKTYGCGTANASKHLLLFRSGSAGFTDMEHGGGTGTLGGFRAGCTANMIAADGILNAPDYTRTCSCSYQNQTSLGLAHMPEMEFWTSFLHTRHTRNLSQGRGDDTVLRLGVNLGAPGSRPAENGTIWLPYPRTDAPNVFPCNILASSMDAGEIPVQITNVSASIEINPGVTSGNLPENTLDGDYSTCWLINSNRRGEFNEWIQYELSKDTIIDKVRVAWTRPQDTDFSVLTSLDGKTWATAYEEKSAAPDMENSTIPDLDGALSPGFKKAETMETYRFNPVKTRYVRLLFGSHDGVRKEPVRESMERVLFLSVSRIEIGELDFPGAYAYFMPKDVFRKYSLFVDGTDGLNWVSSSGVKGIRSFKILDIKGKGRTYSVTLHFSEPELMEPGKRMFDLQLQGKPVKKSFDIIRKAGGPDKAVKLVFNNVQIENTLHIELLQNDSSAHPPLLCGVEIIAEPL